MIKIWAYYRFKKSSILLPNLILVVFKMYYKTVYKRMKLYSIRSVNLYLFSSFQNILALNRIHCIYKYQLLYFDLFLLLYCTSTFTSLSLTVNIPQTSLFSFYDCSARFLPRLSMIIARILYKSSITFYQEACSQFRVPETYRSLWNAWPSTGILFVEWYLMLG